MEVDERTHEGPSLRATGSKHGGSIRRCRDGTSEEIALEHREADCGICTSRFAHADVGWHRILPLVHFHDILECAVSQDADVNNLNLGCRWSFAPRGSVSMRRKLGIVPAHSVKLTVPEPQA